MKITQFLLDKIIGPLVVYILWLLITSILSKMNTGDWLQFFRRISITTWLIAGIVFLAWIIFVVIRNRIKYIKNLDAGPPIFVSHTPVYGWVDIRAAIDYAGVKWRIIAPAPRPGEIFNPVMVPPSMIEVRTPPRCPKCGTELEESRRFWGSYIWKCVSCGEEIKNRDSYDRVVERVKKIVRCNWEKMIESKSIKKS